MLATKRVTAYAYLGLEFARALRTTDQGTTMLVSYPKSGATWLQFMLAEVFRRHFGISASRPTIKLTELTAQHRDLPRIKWTHDCGDFIHEDGGRPNPYRLFAYSARWSYRNKRVLLLIRDPRDVVVSNYHQAVRRSAKPMRFESLSEFLRHPLYGFVRIIRFHEVWYRNRNLPRELVVLRYEDLLEQGPRLLRQLLDCLGIEVRLELMDEVFEMSRPDNLRKLEQSGAVDGMRRFGDDPEALKVRKARAGTFREELSAEDIDFCNRMMSRYPEFDGLVLGGKSAGYGAATRNGS